MEKFIDYYMKWMEKGRMPSWGLCCSLPTDLSHSYTFQLIKPSNTERDKNRKEGGGRAYWGVTDIREQGLRELTPLRETILLLCACINEEY